MGNSVPGGQERRRLVCPHCKANNFEGQAKCWQCQGALSTLDPQKGVPVASPLPAAKNLPPIRPLSEPQPGDNGSMRPIFAAAAVTTFSLVVLLALRLWPSTSSATVSASPSPSAIAPSFSATPPIPAAPMSAMPAPAASASAPAEAATTPSADPEAAGAPDGPAPSAPQAPQPAASPSAPQVTPTASSDGGRTAMEDTARGLIQRSRSGLASPGGPVSSDGKVHLANGGEISPEQYNEARRKLQESPILHQPPASPY